MLGDLDWPLNASRVRIVNEKEPERRAPKARESRRRGGGVWGGGVPLPTGGGVWEGGCAPSPEFFFDFRPRNSVFGAFWALYFTIQLPALRTESGYINVGDRYI